MKVVLIGSGNVATVLGRLIKKNGHEILQVMSRNIDHAQILANELGAHAADLGGIPDINADLYIVAVADYAVRDCLPKFSLQDKLVVHTAGSVQKDVLRELSSNYGVFYPLQSLRREMQDIPEIPFLVDGSSEPVVQYLEAFASSLSPDVQRTSDEDRLKLHVAAVIVSNFTNHLYAIAEEYCQKESVNFDMLKPLIAETAWRIRQVSPAAVQTGPAVRKDIHTLDKHLRLLVNHPKLRTTYLRLTDSIMNP